MQSPGHPSFGRVKTIVELWTGRNMGGRVVDG